MGNRTIRRTSVTLPALKAPSQYRCKVTSLEGGGGRFSDFHYADAELRNLDLVDTHLVDGRITGLKTQSVRLDHLRVDSVEFSDCDLASLQWTDSRTSRTVFRDCTLTGASLRDVTLKDVLFENCRLDHSTFTRVQAAGPVIFSKCSLREAAFTDADLSDALIDDCDLRLTEFDGGKYRGLDMRSNDLSQVCGLAWLEQIVIDPAQTLQLAAALAAELDVAYGESVRQ